MANRNFPNQGRTYSPHVMPVEQTASFVVTSTNPNGITALKGPGIANVYMNTSATPSAGNPNPAAGLIQLQLEDNYTVEYAAIVSTVAPTTGGNLTSVTSGTAYVITAVGTTTTAQWQAKGLLPGLTPAVGQAFIAKATGALGGNGTVKAVGTSGCLHIEACGDPNLTIAPTGTPGLGAVMILQCIGASGVAAPTDGSIIQLRILLNNSSVTGGSPAPGN